MHFQKQFFILDNNAVQTEESSADTNKTNIDGDKKCNESESTDEDEMKRINSEEEKLDRDLTQRLMAKYWKPRKSLAHRLKGKLCSQTTIIFYMDFRMTLIIFPQPFNYS